MDIIVAGGGTIPLVRRWSSKGAARRLAPTKVFLSSVHPLHALPLTKHPRMAPHTLAGTPSTVLHIALSVTHSMVAAVSLLF